MKGALELFRVKIDQSVIGIILTTAVLQWIHCAEPKQAEYSSGQSPPRVLLQGNDLRHVATVGTNIQLSCGTAGADFFDWFKQGDPLAESERIRITDQGALRIKSVSSEDTGHYECKAVNGFGSVTVPFYLLVLESGGTDEKATDDDHTEEESQELDPDSPNNGNLFPARPDHDSSKQGDTVPRSKPEFVHVTKFPHPIIQRPVGSTVRIKCEGKGNPRPQLTWLRDGHPIVTGRSVYKGSKSLGANYHLPAGAKLGRWTLQLQDLQPQDAGNYTCLLHNSQGTKNITFNIEVVDRVRKKPELTGDHPINTTVSAGATATLQCRVRSDVQPHIQWLKRVEKDDLRDFPESISSHGAVATGVEENLFVVEGESFRVLGSSDILENPEGTFLNKLIINDVTESDSGKYVCLGANTLGYNFRSAYLTVTNHQKRRSYENTSPSLNLSSVPFPITVCGSVLGFAVIICIVASLRRYNLRKKTRRRRPDGKEAVATSDEFKRFQRVPQERVANGHHHHHHTRNAGAAYNNVEHSCGLEDVAVHKSLMKNRDSLRPPMLGIECDSSVRTNRSSGNSSCQNAKYYPSRL